MNVQIQLNLMEDADNHQCGTNLKKERLNSQMLSASRYSDAEFWNNFRVTKSTFCFLLEELRPYVKFAFSIPMKITTHICSLVINSSNEYYDKQGMVDLCTKKGPYGVMHKLT